MKIRIIDVARARGQWLLVFEITTPRWFGKARKELVPIVSDSAGNTPTNMLTFEVEKRPKVLDLIRNYIRVSESLSGYDHETKTAPALNRNGDAFMNKLMNDPSIAESFSQGGAFGAMLGGMASKQALAKSCNMNVEDEFRKVDQFKRQLEAMTSKGK